MAFTDRFEKAKKAREEKENPTEVEIKGPTLKAILANNDQFALFGMYLGQKGRQDLAADLVQKGVSRETLDQADPFHAGFLEILQRVENVIKTLDAKTLQVMVKQSSGLQQVERRIGVDGIRAIAVSQFSEMAILDEYRFAEIDRTVSEYTDSMHQIDEQNKEIKGICKKYNISEDDYAKALEGGEGALRAIVTKKMGPFKKRFSGDKIDAAVWSLNTTSSIENLIETRDDNLKELGDVLQLAFSENTSLHEALVANLQGDRIEKPEPDMSFSEVREQPKKEDVEQAWDQYQIDHGDELMLSATSMSQAKRAFAREYGENIKKTKKRKGFWSLISEMLTSSFVEQTLNLI